MKTGLGLFTACKVKHDMKPRYAALDFINKFFYFKKKKILFRSRRALKHWTKWGVSK